MLLLNIDQNSKVAIYQQIMNQIIDLIDAEALKNGEKLPSSRALSERIGVNRSTVYRAYQELWALGYLDCRPGSYSYVRKRITLNKEKKRQKEGTIDWSQEYSASSERLLTTMHKQGSEKRPKGFIDFVSMSIDPRLMPVEEYRKCMNSSLYNADLRVMSYGDPQGYLPLRQFIVQRMQLHGMSVNENEILITNGAQQAIELVLKMFVSKGTSICVENPTYSSALPLFKYFQADMRGIPMNGEGIDLTAFKDTVLKYNPVLLYTMPNFQNPMGITTSQKHREELYNICVKHGVALIEDGFEEEMKYFGKSVLPFKSMDQHGQVFYIGTFSKVLFPGIRVGWIAAEQRVIKNLCRLKSAADIVSNSIVQIALDSFCRKGLYDLHIKRIHRIYRKRMKTALNYAKESFPSSVTWTRPQGGYTFWVETQWKSETESKLMQAINEQGVAVSPGSNYFTNRPLKSCFRISIAHLEEPEIIKGITTIGGVLQDFKG